MGLAITTTGNRDCAMKMRVRCSVLGRSNVRTHGGPRINQAPHHAPPRCDRGRSHSAVTHPLFTYNTATASISICNPGMASSVVPIAEEAGYGLTRNSFRTLRKTGKSRLMFTK
jgi:hypothetical protein